MALDVAFALPGPAPARVRVTPAMATPSRDLLIDLTFWKGKPMETDEFDLDISVLESDDGPASLIVLTDDGCGSSCPSACATNVA